MTTTYLAPAPAVQLLPRLAADTRYVLTGFPRSLIAVIACVTGFAAGLGLAVIWIGVPLMVASLMLARGLAVAERARVAAVLGRPVPSPGYRATGSRIAVLIDPQSWRDLAHAALRFIPSTISFSLVVTWWAGVLGSLTWTLWGWSLPDGPDDAGLPELLGLGDTYLTAAGFYLGLAALFAITLPAVVRGAALLEARFAQSMLARPE